MSLQVRRYGDAYHVTSGNSQFGLGSWAAFSDERVAQNFAAWLEGIGDVEALGERVATGTMTFDDYQLRHIIYQRSRHVTRIEPTKISIYERVYKA